MPINGKRNSRNGPRASRPYLTKRILKSAVRSGVRKAAASTMEIMGCNVIAQNGWVVRVYPDGHVEQISRLPMINQSVDLILD